MSLADTLTKRARECDEFAIEGCVSRMETRALDGAVVPLTRATDFAVHRPVLIAHYDTGEVAGALEFAFAEDFPFVQPACTVHAEVVTPSAVLPEGTALDVWGDCWPSGASRFPQIALGGLQRLWELEPAEGLQTSAASAPLGV